MSEAKVPYCKRIRDEIRFLNRLEKFVYERTSPYVIDKQVELINRAHEDGVKVGRASRDGLREVLEGAQKFVIDQIAEIGACDHSVGHCECEVIRLAENIKKALEDDGEAGK